MPRRSLQQAHAVQIRTQIAKMRVLLRNPSFPKDLSELRKQYCGQNDFNDEFFQFYNAFLRKWRLIWFPQELIRKKDKYEKLTIPELENFIVKEMKAWMPSPDPKAGYLFCPAVLARDPGQDYYDVIGEPHPTLGPAEVLDVRVDLEYPIDVLVALVEGEIKKVLKRHHKVKENFRQQKGLPPLKKKRNRLDKSSFYIKVFDQVSEGKTFEGIARALKQPLSTVKSAFLIIRRSIYEPVPFSKEKTEGDQLIPSKKDVVLTNFDPEKHSATCHTCMDATTFDEMCTKAKVYGHQDQVSLRDRL
ncbi:MAG: hypothetical protein AABZ17_10110 [Nitrospirota bacterium]